MRVDGTVKFLNATKGFEFIEPDGGGKDVFVHASALEAAGIRMLNEGDRVSFVVEDEGPSRRRKSDETWWTVPYGSIPTRLSKLMFPGTMPPPRWRTLVVARVPQHKDHVISKGTSALDAMPHQDGSDARSLA